MLIRVLTVATLSVFKVGPSLEPVVSALLLLITTTDGEMLSTLGCALAWNDAAIDANCVVAFITSVGSVAGASVSDVALVAACENE